RPCDQASPSARAALESAEISHCERRSLGPSAIWIAASVRRKQPSVRKRDSIHVILLRQSAVMKPADIGLIIRSADGLAPACARSAGLALPYHQRTHTNGELRAAEVGKTVLLTGWVAVRRDPGGMVFIDLRDRYGITQLKFNPQTQPDAHGVARDLRSEDCI